MNAPIVLKLTLLTSEFREACSKNRSWTIFIYTKLSPKLSRNSAPLFSLDKRYVPITLILSLALFSTGTFLQWTINGFSRNRKHVRLSWSKETKIKIRVTSRFLFEPNTSILRKRIQIAIYFTCNTCSQSLKVSMMGSLTRADLIDDWLAIDVGIICVVLFMV